MIEMMMTRMTITAVVCYVVPTGTPEDLKLGLLQTAVVALKCAQTDNASVQRFQTLLRLSCQLLF